jgi:DNA transformation protein
MSLSAGFADFLRDVLSGVGDVSIRRMFGGAGVYLDGVMFALVADDTLYLRADEASAPDFAAEGKEPFTYEAKGRAPITMQYWELPERLYDEPDELARWARRAHAIAAAAKPAAKPRARRDAQKAAARSR